MEAPSKKKARLIDFFQSMSKEELMEYFQSVPEEHFELFPEETSETDIWALPDEILVKIISQNPDWTIQDIERTCAVNKKFRDLCPLIYEQIWKRQATSQKVRQFNELIQKHIGVDIPMKRKLLAWRFAYVLFPTIANIDQNFHICCSSSKLFRRIARKDFDIQNPKFPGISYIEIDYIRPHHNYKGFLSIQQQTATTYDSTLRSVVSSKRWKQFGESFSGMNVEIIGDGNAEDTFDFENATWEQIQSVVFSVFCLAATRGDPIFLVEDAAEKVTYEKTKTLYLMGSHICGNCKQSKMEMFHEQNNVDTVFCGKTCQRNFYKNNNK